MICPNCNTNNPVGNQYCMNCGTALLTDGIELMVGYSSPGKALFSITGQTLISVIMLYVFRSVLLGLSFIQELHIANWQITASEIISIIMYLLILVMLVIFARSLSYLWPKVFPRYSGIGVVLTTILYIIGLSVIYTMVKPIFIRFISDPEPLLFLRILLSLIAISLVGWAVVVIYKSIPAWLENLRTSLVVPLSKPITKEE